MKKLFAMILAIAMILTLAVPVMAADGVHNNHSITITETNSGHVYEAYQIFIGDVEQLDNDSDPETIDVTVLSNVKWGTGVDIAKKVNWGTEENELELTLLEALQNATINPTYYSHYLNDTKAEDVVHTLSDNSNTAHAKQFAEIVGKYLTDSCATSTPVDTDITDNVVNGYQITGLSDGYYLVKEKDGNNIGSETATDYILRLVEDVTIAPKDGEVTVEKKVYEGTTPSDVCDNNIGDVVTFDITGSLPSNLAEFDTFFYEFVDTMSEGLTYNEDSLKVYTLNGDTEKEIAATYYTDSITTDNSNTVIKVTFNDLKKLTASGDYTVRSTTKIVVKYTATVNAKAEIGNDGNPNEAYIKFTRSPYTNEDPSQTPPDIVHVFTFQLDVTKIDGSTRKNLAGVKFVLARERQGAYEYVVLETVKDKNDNEIQRVKGWTTSKDEATQLETDAAGKFSVTGLDTDLYWLIETQGLEGYEEIDPIKFTIKAGYDTTKQTVTKLEIIIDNQSSEGNADTGIVATTVVNNPGKELPSTGGVGTTLFYVFGGMMVVGALVVLISKKRMVA